MNKEDLKELAEKRQRTCGVDVRIDKRQGIYLEYLFYNKAGDEKYMSLSTICSIYHTDKRRVERRLDGGISLQEALREIALKNNKKTKYTVRGERVSLKEGAEMFNITTETFRFRYQKYGDDYDKLKECHKNLIYISGVGKTLKDWHRAVLSGPFKNVAYDTLRGRINSRTLELFNKERKKCGKEELTTAALSVFDDLRNAKG